jgi:hypothetical protein
VRASGQSGTAGEAAISARSGARARGAGRSQARA